MKKIRLKKGKHAIVDHNDFKKVKPFTWWYEKTSRQEYAYSKHANYGSTIRMHTLIAGQPPKGFVIDHRNGNGLDNRKKNLRFVSRALNALNSAVSAGFYVCPSNTVRKFVVVRFFQNKKYYGGSFATVIEARKVSQKLRLLIIKEAIKTGHEVSINMSKMSKGV